MYIFCNKRDMEIKVTYCVRTNNARDRQLKETIDSIKRQQGDKELIITGILKKTSIDFGKFIPMFEEANTGQTSAMRDRGFKEATGDYIVAMDDDIILHDDFQDNIGTEDIQIPVTYNLTSGRFWDWCVINHPDYGHRKMPYDFCYTPYHYLSGQCFIIKADIAKQVQHSTEIKFHEVDDNGVADDVDYGRRLQKAGYEFTMNTGTTCKHFDPRYIDWNNGAGVATI